MVCAGTCWSPAPLRRSIHPNTQRQAPSFIVSVSFFFLVLLPLSFSKRSLVSSFLGAVGWCGRVSCTPEKTHAYQHTTPHAFLYSISIAFIILALLLFYPPFLDVLLYCLPLVLGSDTHASPSPLRRSTHTNTQHRVPSSFTVFI